MSGVETDECVNETMTPRQYSRNDGSLQYRCLAVMLNESFIAGRLRHYITGQHSEKVLQTAAQAIISLC